MSELKYFRHKKTKLIARYSESFAGRFSDLEPVSDAVAHKGTTVEENVSKIEDANTAPTADSSKEGNK